MQVSIFSTLIHRYDKRGTTGSSTTTRRKIVANYLAMIYDNEARWATATEEDTAEIQRAHHEFGGTNGHAIRGGARLAGSDAATSIRKGANGEVAVTDGTFAETKEVLGGYYVIEADDLDQALAIARQIPTLAGGIELRPIIPS
jgi:hypothetical protein